MKPTVLFFGLLIATGQMTAMDGFSHRICTQDEAQHTDDGDTTVQVLYPTFLALLKLATDQENAVVCQELCTRLQSGKIRIENNSAYISRRDLAYRLLPSVPWNGVLKKRIPPQHEILFGSGIVGLVIGDQGSWQDARAVHVSHDTAIDGSAFEGKLIERILKGDVRIGGRWIDGYKN